MQKENLQHVSAWILSGWCNMQQVTNREQLWEKLGQLDPFQQQSVAAFIDSLLKPQISSGKHDKRDLLTLSVWTDEDIILIQETQDRINAWNFPVS